jgi:hypothetical protein
MNDDHNEELDQGPAIITTEWWLASLGNVMVWARLRVEESDAADVLSSDGLLIRYPDVLEARTALMDAGYQSLDGMDEDDALPFGKSLEELEPPQPDGDSDEELVPFLIERINANRDPGTYSL